MARAEYKDKPGSVFCLKTAKRYSGDYNRRIWIRVNPIRKSRQSVEKRNEAQSVCYTVRNTMDHYCYIFYHKIVQKRLQPHPLPFC